MNDDSNGTTSRVSVKYDGTGLFHGMKPAKVDLNSLIAEVVTVLTS